MRVLIPMLGYRIETLSSTLVDFYLYYEQYVKGGRLIRCSECGKLVLSQSKTYQPKYCKKCAKQINIEKTNGLR